MAKLVDKRLLGTWKSDRRRTFEGWLFPEGLSQDKRERFKRLSGKLTIRFTPSRMISGYRGDRQNQRYRVVAKDRSSVAILAWDSKPSEADISHIHFEKRHLWLLSSAGQREYFRKVKG